MDLATLVQGIVIKSSLFFASINYFRLKVVNFHGLDLFWA
jgi:hypothetical protein